MSLQQACVSAAAWRESLGRPAVRAFGGPSSQAQRPTSALTIAAWEPPSAIRVRWRQGPAERRASVARKDHGSQSAGSRAAAFSFCRTAVKYSKGFSPRSSAV